jgi:hypothetical protein
MYIPIYGYLDVDDDHRARVEHFFHVPMIILALLVLPLLVVEWSYAESFHLAHPLIQIAIYATGAIIWFAFLVEFVVKVSIARSRVDYMTRNWLDIVIVVLPMLRPFRALRVVRAAQVTRLSRVFKIRGVIFKLLRTAAAAVVGLEFFRRLGERFRGPVAKTSAPDYAKWSRAALIAEISRLNDRISLLEAQARHHHEPFPRPTAEQSNSLLDQQPDSRQG